MHLYSNFVLYSKMLWKVFVTWDFQYFRSYILAVIVLGSTNAAVRLWTCVPVGCPRMTPGYANRSTEHVVIAASCMGIMQLTFLEKFVERKIFNNYESVTFNYPFWNVFPHLRALCWTSLQDTSIPEQWTNAKY